MADSNITRKALADALKTLMNEKDFHKINVSDICELCGMNRKSFYYHFQDKYDLMNWIFNTEMVHQIEHESDAMNWKLFYTICKYLYDNRSFYKKALQIEGQNSFSEYFRSFLQPLIKADLMENYDDIKTTEFHLNFFTDAILSAITRWITSSDCMHPEDFVAEVDSCIYICAKCHDNEIEKE